MEIKEELIPEWLFSPVVTSELATFCIYDPEHTFWDYIHEYDRTIPQTLLWKGQAKDANTAVWTYMMSASPFTQERYTYSSFQHTLHGRDLIIEISDETK